MESEEGGTHVEAPIESSRPARHVAYRHVTYPESRRARLSEASHQLAVVPEGVDLDAEPALAQAVTDAVAAVDRASAVAEPRDVERSKSKSRSIGKPIGVERTVHEERARGTKRGKQDGRSERRGVEAGQHA